MRQAVFGSRNMVIGTVGPGATVNIHTDDPTSRAAAELLRQARLAYHSSDPKQATSLAATAVAEFRNLSQPSELELALLMLGYASVESYKTARDTTLLTRYAIPSFTELRDRWKNVATDKKQQAECAAYLAWCQHWLTNNEFIVRPLVQEVSDLAGKNSELARWAERALTNTKIESNVKFGVGFTAALAVWVGVVALVVAALGWFLDQII